MSRLTLRMAATPSGGPAGSRGTSVVIVFPRTGERMTRRAPAAPWVAATKISSFALLTSVMSIVVVGLASTDEKVATPVPTMLLPGQPRVPLATRSESGDRTARGPRCRSGRPGRAW